MILQLIETMFYLSELYPPQSASGFEHLSQISIAHLGILYMQ